MYTAEEQDEMAIGECLDAVEHLKMVLTRYDLLETIGMLAPLVEAMQMEIEKRCEAAAE